MIEATFQTAAPKAASTPVPPQTPRLLDQLRDALRVRHYGLRTEKTYAHRPPLGSQAQPIRRSLAPMWA